MFPLFKIQRHLAGLSHEKMWFPNGSFCLKQPKTECLTPWNGDFDGILRNEDLKFISVNFAKSSQSVGYKNMIQYVVFR